MLICVPDENKLFVYKTTIYFIIKHYKMLCYLAYCWCETIFTVKTYGPSKNHVEVGCQTYQSMKEVIPSHSWKGPEIKKILFYRNLLNVLYIHWPGTKNKMAFRKLQKTTSRKQWTKSSELLINYSLMMYINLTVIMKIKLK